MIEILIRLFSLLPGAGEWLADPGSRAAFIAGSEIGFWFGLLCGLCSGGFVAWGIRWYEKRRKEKKQEREKPKPALGLLWTRELQPLCPVCKTPLPEFRTSRDDKGMCCVCPSCHQLLRLPARFASFAEARAEAARELHRK